MKGGASMRALSGLILVVTLSGCLGAQRVRYVDSTKAPTGARYTQRLNFFLGGLGKGAVDTARCGAAGAAKVTTYFSVPDNLLGLVTLFIYVPRHVHVTCAGASA